VKKPYFKYLVYLSFIFLAVALYKSDYLRLPEVRSYWFLTASLVFLFLGMTSHAFCWQTVMSLANHPVGIWQCTAAAGLSVFGKYMPGKVWTVLGKAAYTIEKTGHPTSAVLTLALSEQLLIIWFGLIFGALGLCSYPDAHHLGLIVLSVWLAVSLILFFPWFRNTAERIARRVLKRDISIPGFELGSIPALIPWFSVNWLLKAVAFYFLVECLIGGQLPYTVGLVYPLSVTLGIISFIPAGLGVREGVMVGCLNLSGLTTADAITVSATARVWFFVGEVFAFLLGVLGDRIVRKQTAE
jgi:glycosyltransferase 2 family protein